MAKQKDLTEHKRSRYSRHATKRRMTLRMPTHIGRIVAIVLAAVGVIALALVWGSVLKAKSDAYRSAEEAGEWTVEENVTPVLPVSVPDVRARAIDVGESVGILRDRYSGVVLTLRDGEGHLTFASRVAATAGIPTADLPDLPDLSDELTRISRSEMYVIGTFAVTSFSEADAALAAYQRGLEMSLLRELAESGIDDILLTGLPAGNDAADALTVAYLSELSALLSGLADRPAIGVSIPLSAFETEDAEDIEDAEAEETDAPVYGGRLTPGRLLRACDYLAMDLRGIDPVTAEQNLPHLAYPYTRHALRLVLPREASELIDVSMSHGFGRLVELAT